MKIYKRKVFDKITPFLDDEIIIVIYGARQVGKTYLLYYLKNHLEKKGEQVFYYDLEYPELLTTLNQGVPSFLLDLKNRGYNKGKVYVLIDEIQYLDNPSSFLKIVADHHKDIHLIVSGSSTFNIKTKFTDSLAGRTINFEFFPLSFAEFLEFKQSPYQISKKLTPAAFSTLKTYFYEFITYGGYPKIVLENEGEKKKQYLLQLIDTYVRKDVADLAKIEDIRKFNQLLKILASQSGQLLDYQALSSQTGITFPTLKKYLNILEETFIIKLISPYSRSPKVEIRKNPKIFFYDSGLLSLLWLSNFAGNVLLGNIFETVIFAQLVKEFGREDIYFWRTKTGQEVDFILEKQNQIIPLEVKHNFNLFKEKKIKSFLKKYRVNKWWVIGLEGEKKKENFIYPWELNRIG